MPVEGTEQALIATTNYVSAALATQERHYQLRITMTTSAWSPLRKSLFRDRWIASIVSNIGGWMEDTAGAWLMTEKMGFKPRPSRTAFPDF